MNDIKIKKTAGDIMTENERTEFWQNVANDMLKIAMWLAGVAMGFTWGWFFCLGYFN